jgi:immune inhibitor A
VQAPVRTFTDDKGWYPGIEFRNGGYFYRDADASTVVPSQGNSPYTFRIVNPDGSPATDQYGADFGFPDVAGTGNPGDQGVGYGTVVDVAKAMKGNQSAQVKITPPTP